MNIVRSFKLSIPAFITVTIVGNDGIKKNLAAIKDIYNPMSTIIIEKKTMNEFVGGACHQILL